MLKPGLLRALFCCLAFGTGYWVSEFFGRADLESEMEKTRQLTRDLHICAAQIDALTIEGEFEAVSDSVWTPTQKIKYRRAQDAETRTDSLVFVADEKIKLAKWQKHNDSLEEVRLRTEIDHLKSSHR
jgi:hypothetical protein